MGNDPQLVAFAYGLVFMIAVGGLVLMAVMNRSDILFRKGGQLFALGVAGIVAFYVMHNPDFTHWAAGEVALAAVGAIVVLLKILSKFKD